MTFWIPLKSLKFGYFNLISKNQNFISPQCYTKNSINSLYIKSTITATKSNLGIFEYMNHHPTKGLNHSDLRLSKWYSTGRRFMHTMQYHKANINKICLRKSMIVEQNLDLLCFKLCSSFVDLLVCTVI